MADINRLSAELLEEIFSYLPLKDSIAFGRTCHKMSELMRDRADPVLYLSRDFDYPLSLLYMLGDTGSVISGSRALEFFVPGSTSEDSDWDFYVPGTIQGVLSMMHELSHNGVTWDTGFIYKVLEFCASGSPDNMDITGREMSKLWYMGHETWDDLVESVSRAQKDVLQSCKRAANPENSGITLLKRWKNGTMNICVKRRRRDRNNFESNGDQQFEGHSTLESYGEQLEVIEGKMERRGRVKRVQMIICKNYEVVGSPFDYISRFYATHVQCFIAGYFAGHFYNDMASKKCAILWNAEDRALNKIQGCVEKYKKRSFSIVTNEALSSPKTPHYTRFREKGSFAIKFEAIYKKIDSMTSKEGQLWMICMGRADAHLRNLAWGAFNGRMHLLLNDLAPHYGTGISNCRGRPFPLQRPPFTVSSAMADLRKMPPGVSTSVAWFLVGNDYTTDKKCRESKDHLDDKEKQLMASGHVFPFKAREFWRYPGNGIYLDVDRQA